MSTFNESDHPRREDGRFAAKTQGEVDPGLGEIGNRPHPPAGWRENDDGTAVCPHRDLSVCSSCANEPELVDGRGAYFWIGDSELRAEAKAALGILSD